jgi:hypothetical protein
MKLIIRHARNCVLGATLLCTATAAHADEFDLIAKRLADQIAKAKITMASWVVQGEWQFGLAMAVVVLGAIVAAMQQLGAKKWTSYSVGIIGLVISLLTFITNNYFDADHKTYKKYVHSATRYIDDAEWSLDRLKTETVLEQKSQLVEEITKKISNFQELDDRIVGTAPDVPKTAYESAVITTAYAQSSGRPPWITEQPGTQNATAYRFVGVASDQSLAVARIDSLENAQRNAASKLSIVLGRAKQYARQIDTYTEYDPAQKVYHYYTLIEVNKALVP